MDFSRCTGLLKDHVGAEASTSFVVADIVGDDVGAVVHSNKLSMMDGGQQDWRCVGAMSDSCCTTVSQYASSLTQTLMVRAVSSAPPEAAQQCWT